MCQFEQANRCSCANMSLRSRGGGSGEAVGGAAGHHGDGAPWAWGPMHDAHSPAPSQQAQSSPVSSALQQGPPAPVSSHIAAQGSEVAGAGPPWCTFFPQGSWEAPVPGPLAQGSGRQRTCPFLLPSLSLAFPDCFLGSSTLGPELAAVSRADTTAAHCRCGEEGRGGSQLGT